MTIKSEHMKPIKTGEFGLKNLFTTRSGVKKDMNIRNMEDPLGQNTSNHV